MFYAAFHSHSYPLQTSTEAQFRTLVATLEVDRKYSFRSSLSPSIFQPAKLQNNKQTPSFPERLFSLKNVIQLSEALLP